MSKLLAVVRIKGTMKVPMDVRETLDRLNLKKKNWMAFYYDSPAVRGMIKRAGRYVAWGEVENQDLIQELLKKRGRLKGERRLDQKALEQLGCKAVEELAGGILNGDLKAYRNKGLINIFKLTPPTGGLPKAGSSPRWGYYGSDISTLISCMM
jgi:large subunit ribosomal protein L30